MRRLDLVPECGSCAAVCCVATSFETSDDFAFDKAANVPCRHVTRDHACAIHAHLVQRGMRGCAIYDCYGAGQRVTRMFPAPCEAERRNEAFLELRVVHEWLWQLTEAAKLCPSLADDIAGEVAKLDAVLPGGDTRPRRDAVRALLRRARGALRILD
jgi:hypothetical protein